MSYYVKVLKEPHQYHHYCKCHIEKPGLSYLQELQHHSLYLGNRRHRYPYSDLAVLLAAY